MVSSDNVKRLGLLTFNPIEYHGCDIVPIEFGQYNDKIWCDVVPIYVGNMILSRPWLFDLNVTLYGKSNTCVFEFKGKKIKLTPLSLKA